MLEGRRSHPRSPIDVGLGLSELRRIYLPRTRLNKAPREPVCDLTYGPRFGNPMHGYTKDSASYGWQGDAMMDRNAANSRMDPGAEGAQAEWLSAMQSLAEQIEKQQQYSQQMTQELMNTYMQLLNTPGSYLTGQAEQQQQTIQQTAQQWMEQAQQQQQSFQQQAQEQQQSFQQMTQEVMSSYSQLFNIPLSYAKEGLTDAQFPIEGYDRLTVEEVSARLGALSAEDLREVRDHEERNKNRETILEQLDRRIRGTS